ncbi:hypothetical protein GQ53DRAFT_867074 [Thozetella sp. PMI_491]|nr:hypothetical protein GQ53DRAFT_867074 [Thozetella sp. PMI_491]
MQFKAFYVLSLFAVLSNAAATPRAGQFTLPPDLQEGHYEADGSVNPETGFATIKYVGPIDEDALAKRTTTPESLGAAGSPSGLSRRDSTNCNYRGAGDSTSAAQFAFEDQWDNYYTDAKFLFTVRGTSVAYFCNYGIWQTIHRQDFDANMVSINSLCGQPNAGYYRHDSWVLAYGRDDVYHSFC